MKILRCAICSGEVDIVGDDLSLGKKTKCRHCGITNAKSEKKEPEVFVIRKRSSD